MALDCMKRWAVSIFENSFHQITMLLYHISGRLSLSLWYKNDAYDDYDELLGSDEDEEYYADLDDEM